MRIDSSFAFAMLMAGTQAFDDISWMLNPNPGQLNDKEDKQTSLNIFDKFSAWNCATCNLAMDGVDRVLTSDTFDKAFLSLATKICLASGAVPNGKEICPAMTKQYEDALIKSLSTNLISGSRICNETLGLCPRHPVEELDLHTVVNNILATKPASLANDDFVDNLYAEMANDSAEREIIRAVHISDVHIDREYTEGMNAKCGSFLCCRTEFGPAPEGGINAGYWGSNAGVCDLPEHTFVNLMEFVAGEIQPDLLFWTGDNSSHNIWSNTVEEVTSYTELVTNMIKDAVKDTDITVVPIHGNHDTWPVDEQDFAAPNANYSINHIKEYWSDWLGEEATSKYGEYGYYSMDLELKSGKELPAGSKVIAYNTNSCD